MLLDFNSRRTSMNACICKSTVLIMASLLFCSMDHTAWSQTQFGNPQGRTSSSESPYSDFHLSSLGDDKIATEADCTAAKLGATIPVSAIGEPVSGVTLNVPEWTGAAGSNPAYCTVNGSMAPVSKEPDAKPINFRVVLPASWSRRAAQLGGGGMNGSIPNLLGRGGHGAGGIAYSARICHLRQRFRTPDGGRFRVRTWKKPKARPERGLRIQQ